MEVGFASLMTASTEQVERTIACFRQATEANRATPSRQGNLVLLGPEQADEVLLTGDLHGNRDNFELLLAAADLEHFPRRHLVLQEVCHGGPTYPDSSGCMSHTLLEDVAALKVRYPERVHFLLGNHELAELANFPIQKNHKMLNIVFRIGLERTYGEAADLVHQAYLPFLESCPLAVRLANGLFVSHSIPERVDQYGFDTSVFDRPIESWEYFERGPVFELLWGRDYREVNARAFAELVGSRLLVNGHEPSAAGHSSPNPLQIILDCCGQQPGWLLLRTDRDYTRAELLEQIRTLHRP
jgi:hypothetical protein